MNNEEPDIFALYELMFYSRRFEEMVQELWDKGKIFGEMHMSLGEEAINAGVISHLVEGDAIALDHRGTSPLIMRGINPKKLLLELLGHPNGLCRGNGGHMHLFSKEHLVASSGIVGASGPAAVGFALASKYKKRQNIAIAFFGEGAANQSMMLSSLNLASAWNLPVLFVCKDNDVSITTPSKEVTGGNLTERAKSFGINGIELNGLDVEFVWQKCASIIDNMRKTMSPFFIVAKCIHKEGHLLGDSILRAQRSTIKESIERTGPLLKSLTRLKGASILKRGASIAKIMSLITKIGDQLKKRNDPLVLAKNKLKKKNEKLKLIESKVNNQIETLIFDVMKTIEGDE